MAGHGSGARAGISVGLNFLIFNAFLSIPLLFHIDLNSKSFEKRMKKKSNNNNNKAKMMDCI